MFEDILQTLGLTDEEASIYLALLDHGPQSASQLAKTSKVKRTYVYPVARSLITKGLVTQGKKLKGTVFTPLSPDRLLALAEEKKQTASQAERTLDGILHTLKGKYTAMETRPIISYYEGVAGVKKVYLDTIKEKQEILALVETSKVDPTIYNWVTREYVKLRVAAGISVKAIVASGPNTKQYVGLNQKELRETKVISSDNYPFEHEINVYGGKVAIINHKKGTSLLGIIIDNPVVAQNFRSWFTLTWDLLK